MCSLFLANKKRRKINLLFLFFFSGRFYSRKRLALSPFNIHKVALSLHYKKVGGKVMSMRYLMKEVDLRPFVLLANVHGLDN